MSEGLKLISSVLATGSAATLLRAERESFLENELTAYEFVKGHLRTYRELPTAQTVQQETGIRLPSANETLQYYVDRVQDRYYYNQIRDQFGHLRDGMQSANMTVVTDTVGSMSRILRRRRTSGSSRSSNVVSLDEGIDLTINRLREIRGSGGVSGVTTGWDHFDSITGGYQNSDIITWVGRPQLGKTYVILRQAHKAYEDGENVLFVTTEMGIEQISRRSVALKLGINPRLLQTGAISTHLERRIQSLRAQMVGAERFKIFSVGMHSKVSTIEGLIQEFGPSVLFIDGVYLLRPTEATRNASRTDRITGVFDELKAMNIDTEIPFVLTTQFNRQAGKGGKEGSLETIGYTDAIGTHSSVIVAIKEGPTENPKESRTFDFLKGREGESGEIAINFKFAPLNMEEMTREEREAEGEVTQETVQWMGVGTRTEA